MFLVYDDSSEPLGMADNRIPDNDILAPSWHNWETLPIRGKLKQSFGSWSPYLDSAKKDLQFLMVDLGKFHRKVTAVATQG